MTTGARNDENADATFEEEYESIPWDALVRPRSPDWRRLTNTAALLVALAALATLAVRTLWPTGQVESLAATSDPSTTLAVAPPSPTSTVDSGHPPLPTEADLRAIDPASFERVAAAYAEWYVADYFTVDGVRATIDPVTGIAPVGSDGTGGVSYVESATAIEVTQSSPDRHRVTVVVRSLSATDPSLGYRRDPVRAVLVTVSTATGRPVVDDLPQPIEVPTLLGTAEPLVDTVVGSEIVEAARAVVVDLGMTAEEPYSVGRAPDGSIRVAMIVTDFAGLRRPMAIWVDPDGSIRG